MKKHSGKNLIQWFYHFLVVLFMAMPLMSTLVRCLYVQFNHNAFESYYGETINQESIEPVSNIENGHDYIIYLNGTSSNFSNTLNFTCADISYYVYSTTTGFFDNGFFYYNGGQSANYCALRLGTGSYIYYPLTQVTLYIYSYHGSSNAILKPYFNEVIYNTYSFLDNAFDYSIEKTYNEYKNTTLVDFTSFFNNVFIDYTDNLYMNFATWYIGWVLSCAIVSFVPYVLLSFYHLAIHVIDKFSRKGENL